MTLIGLHVTQYMHVLFDKVHIYIKYLSLHWHVTFTSSKNIRCYCREPHHFAEILIINVDENSSFRHGNIDIPLLNATAVSDLKKTLPKKQTMQ